MSEPKPPREVAIGWAFSKVPAVGGLAKDLYHNANEWRRFRAEQTAQEIAEIVGPEELYERARENEELAALLVQVLELAERTGFEAKRRLLVKAAANAFQDDAAIDPALLVTHALRQLDAVHIRTLARLVGLADSPDGTEKKLREAGEKLPVPVLVTLVNTGVVTHDNRMLGGGMYLCDITDFGRHLLRELQNADPRDQAIRWVPPE